MKTHFSECTNISPRVSSNFEYDTKTEHRTKLKNKKISLQAVRHSNEMNQRKYFSSTRTRFERTNIARFDFAVSLLAC